MRAIASAIRAAFSAGHWVLKQTAKGLEKVWERLPSWPSFGGGGVDAPEKTEAEAGHEAANDETQRAEQEERRERIDAVATAIRRVARSILDGQQPDVELAAAVAPWHLRYLQAIQPHELARIADPSVSGRRACRALAEGLVPEGLPDADAALARAVEKNVSTADYAFRARVAAYRRSKLGLAPGAKDAEQDGAAGHAVGFGVSRAA
jgi:hypothetical protein